MDLENLVVYVKKGAKIIIESGEEHQPMVFILSSDKLSTVGISRLDKDMFKQVLAKLLQQFCAYAYVFVNEAWTASLAADSPLIPRMLTGEILVPDLPLDDREEVLTILAVENGKFLYTWSARIKYAPDDERYLGEWEKAEGIIGGRFVLKEW